jgi:hypothetical protein
MYFFYFDESGSRDPRASIALPDGSHRPKDHIYVLTALSLYEHKWRPFDREIANLKLELVDHIFRTRRLKFDLADCEVKSNWIRNPKERKDKSPFLDSLSDADRERLMACYFRQVVQQRMTVFAVVIDKRKLHGHVDSQLLHKKAYELLLERIEHFMAEFHSKHQAVIVMDDTDKSLNRAISMKHAFFQREGNQNIHFNHIVEYPFFTDSKLSNGVQLADLCAYNIYRAFKTQDFKYAYFRELLPHFYKREKGEQLDGLKVFPNESDLVQFSREGWIEFKTEQPTLWSRLRKT